MLAVRPSRLGRERDVSYRYWLLVMSLASAICFVPRTGATGSVVCKATSGYHCEHPAGCVADATYISTYLINWEKRNVTQTSIQHTRRDVQPQPDGTVYTIVNRSTNPKTGESTIIAVANVGLAATELILIGEKSYLSSSVSSLGPRVLTMIGTCQGFRPQ